MQQDVEAQTHHLLCRVDRHACVQEASIQEGDPGLQAKGKRSLVGSEDIPLMEAHHFPHSLSAQELTLMETSG